MIQSDNAARLSRLLIASFVLALIAIGLLASRPRPSPIRAADQQLDADAFAGAAACAGCHPRESKEFAKTGHARALSRGDSDETVQLLAGRTASVPVPGQTSPMTVQFRQENGYLWAETSSEPTDAVPVHWWFGSGRAGMTPVTIIRDNAGRSRLLEHHISWFRDGDLFALTPGHQPKADATGIEQFGDASGPSNVRICFSCHTTSFTYESSQFDPSSVVAGIQCERCHGPRKQHVQVKLQSLTTAPAASPPKRTARQQISDCGECHRRPDEIHDPITPDNATLARFPSVGLVQSKCYLATESKATFTCLTCHDPHRADHPSESFYENRCNDCHNPRLGRDATVCSVNSGTSGCIGCHMPKVRLHEHLEFTDHWIRRSPFESSSGLSPAHRPM
jgi:hypothetical protein